MSFCAAGYFTHVEAHGARRTPPNVLLVRATRLEVLSVRCASRVANAVACFKLECKACELNRVAWVALKLGKLGNQLGSETLVKAPWWLLPTYKRKRSPQREGQGVRQGGRGGRHTAAGGGGQLRPGRPRGEPGGAEEPRAWAAARRPASHLPVTHLSCTVLRLSVKAHMGLPGVLLNIRLWGPCKCQALVHTHALGAAIPEEQPEMEQHQHPRAWRGSDAKLVVLDWDAATDSIAPSSLHCFESDPLLHCGRAVFAQPPRALADPQVHPMSSLEGFSLAGSAASCPYEAVK